MIGDFGISILKAQGAVRTSVTLGHVLRGYSRDSWFQNGFGFSTTNGHEDSQMGRSRRDGSQAFPFPGISLGVRDAPLPTRPRGEGSYPRATARAPP